MGNFKIESFSVNTLPSGGGAYKTTIDIKGLPKVTIESDTEEDNAILKHIDSVKDYLETVIEDNLK